MATTLADKSPQNTISEGYGKIYNFTYDRSRRDPQPKLLLLGRWQNKRAGKTGGSTNRLTCGINLNYLDQNEIEDLRDALPSILKGSTTKHRYQIGNQLIPGIFDKAYRTYIDDFIHQVAQPVEPTDELMPPEPPEPLEKTFPTTKGKPRVPQPRAAKVSPDRLKRIKGKIKELPKMSDEEFEDLLDRIGIDRENLMKSADKEVARRTKKRAKSVAAKTVDNLRDVEKEQETQKVTDAVDDLKEIEQPEEAEDEYDIDLESFDRNVDAIVESLIAPEIKWKNPNDYLRWHTFDGFFENHPRTKRPVIDSCHAGRFLAVYDVVYETLVVDIAQNHAEILSEANIEYDDAICMSIDNGKLNAFYSHPMGHKALQELMETEFGDMVNILCNG